jgi:hypothetical protein
MPSITTSHVKHNPKRRRISSNETADPCKNVTHVPCVCLTKRAPYNSIKTKLFERTNVHQQ